MSSRNDHRDDAAAFSMMAVLKLLVGGFVLFYVAGDNFGVFATLLLALGAIVTGSLLLDLD